MNLSIKTKFDYGQIVNCRFKEYNKGELAQGKINSVQVCQTEHMRPECFMISYLVEPLEYIGYEHDEEEWIPECHKNDLPCIIDLV